MLPPPLPLRQLPVLACEALHRGLSGEAGVLAWQAPRPLAGASPQEKRRCALAVLQAASHLHHWEEAALELVEAEETQLRQRLLLLAEV